MSVKNGGKQREEGFTKLQHEYGSLLGLDLIAAVVLSEIVHWWDRHRHNPKRNGWNYKSESQWKHISPSLTSVVLEGRKQKRKKTLENGETTMSETKTPGAFARIEAAYQSMVPNHEQYGPVILKQVGRPKDFKERKKPGKETFYKLNPVAFEEWLKAAKAAKVGTSA